VQTIKNQFDARGDAELVEDANKVIAHDYLLGAGWTARSVAISCYLLRGLSGVWGGLWCRVECGGL
jgi:hypothetical protein